jgi:flagellar basal-body rod protein FlgB
MFSPNDRIFGPHAAALGLWSQRNELLASNIANADTPGFKARDVDFKSVLRGAAATAVRVTKTNPGHMELGVDAASDPSLLYRIPHQPSLDGNTVEADVEQAEFAKNALRYQASLRFVTGRVSSLRNAITGGQ